jgi:RNA polymerase sigma-B factor
MARYSKTFRLTKEQRALAAANINLARDIAWKYQRRTNIEYSILESAAFEGLCQAAARYDPEMISDRTGRAVKFSSLAVPYIRGGILHYIRDRTYSMRLTHRMRESWSKGRKLMNKGMTDLEVAAALEIDITEWQDAKSACSGPPLELKDQATPTEALEAEEFDNLTHFRQEAETILEEMSGPLKRRLERFCRGRSVEVPLLIAQELPRYLGCATVNPPAQ